MAELTGKAVSELTEATSLGDSSLFAISVSGYSRSISGRTVKDAVLGLGTEVAANTDLDTLTTPGVYYVSSTNAASIVNGPPITSYAYRVEVYVAGTTNASYRTQVAMTNMSSTLFVRSMYGSSISAWRRILDDAALPLSIPNGGTGATSAKDAAVALGLAYDAGTFSASTGCWGYFLAASTNQLRLFFVPQRSLRYASSVTVNSITNAAIRHVGGGTLSSTLTDYVTSAAIWGGAISILLTKSDGWGVTANTPVTGYAEVSFTLT